MHTIQFPWIVVVQKYCWDDVWLAWKQGGFAAEEVDDELFIRWEEVEPWRKVRSSTHGEVRSEVQAGSRWARSRWKKATMRETEEGMLA